VSWSQVGLSNLGSVLVCLEGLVGRLLSLVTNSELGEVAVVVTLPEERTLVSFDLVRSVHKICLHLVVENLRLSALGRRNQVFVQNLEDIFADLSKLGFDLLTVLLD
jgi:hypothetical protein